MQTSFSNKTSPILVTGATGYIASHLIKILLENGFKVRGTVRSLSNKEKYQFLENLVPSKQDNLTFVEADLTDKSSWLSAMEGCDYVFHLASPIPVSIPKDEMDIIGPAVEGTVNVLEAAVAKGVKKVVITSSVAAIAHGHQGLITEEFWSKEEMCPPYPKSKLRAEKAAWEFYEHNKGKLELTVINSCLVLGPMFTQHKNTSESLLSEIIKGNIPGVSDSSILFVDVRDVADAHFKAMFTEKTNGKRYIIASESTTMPELVRILNKEFQPKGFTIPEKIVTVEELKNSGSPIGPRLAMIGGRGNLTISNKRGVEELDMKYRSHASTLVDMGNSLINLEIISPNVKK